MGRQAVGVDIALRSVIPAKVGIQLSHTEYGVFTSKICNVLSGNR